MGMGYNHLLIRSSFYVLTNDKSGFFNPQVHAGGSGLERGVQGQPTDFNVWTREAGHGSLAISVEGPSKAIVDFKVHIHAIFSLWDTL